MPKKSKHPKFRTHTKRGVGGKVWVSYWYDMRGGGKPDVSLGTDYAAALARWRELNEGGPRIKGTLREAFDRWEEEVLPNYTSAETRKGYARNLKRLRPAMEKATWGAITLKGLKGYLKARTAKTQGNRELSLLSVIWNWARTEGLTDLPWPAHGMEKAKWKNKEHARKFKVDDELFAAVYAFADQTLKDCMDLASATGMRLTDCRTVLLPRGDTLHLDANKTGKEADFDLSLSEVLPDLVKRRRAVKASHLMLLSTPQGRQVSQSMLRDRWDAARAKAAALPENAAISARLKAMILRDMRKRAAQLAGSDQEASNLLQHGSIELTRKHYQPGNKTRPVR